MHTAGSKKAAELRNIFREHWKNNSQVQSTVILNHINIERVERVEIVHFKKHRRMRNEG
jgi:hypothetical protein